MSRIDTAYNYFMTTYGANIGSKYESHKKSELRDTYNKIVKANKESPLYKFSNTADIGQFAIDIKEHANNIALSISNLTANGEDISSVLEKRIAYSSAPDSVDVVYVGDSEGSAEEFTIDVDSLAEPQINRGNYLAADGHDFEEGQYSFDLDIRNHSYEFQFNVNPGETNLNVQNKIVRLLNSSDVGLKANLVTNYNNANAIEISSKSTGRSDDNELLFNIASTISWRELHTLGIDNVIQKPSNSSFELNGMTHESVSNTFTVNKSYELTLKKPTDELVNIGLMNDTEALSTGVNQLLFSYNGMIDVGLKYTDSHQNRTLFNEISSIAKTMSSSLSAIGITSDALGHLSLDSTTLSDAVNGANRDETFATLNDFKANIRTAATKASINPMYYVDKAVVEYKNPGKTLTAPYATSAYSGMMCDYGL